MNEEQEKLERECTLCSDAYKEKYHCPRISFQTDSLLVRIACQVEHAIRRERMGIS